MSKENIFQGIIALVIAGVSAYFQIIAIPVLVLVSAMIIDYITGLAGAYVSKQLNSRIGIVGIIKKVGYLGLVAVGMVSDYIIYSAMSQIGVEITLGYCVGMVITIWLIINELISILENLAEIGVPLPVFITKLINRLKNTIENKTDDI